MSSAPFLIETRTDMFGTFEQRWMCEPPDETTSFRVVEEEWDDEYTVRTIKRIEL